MLSAHSLTHLHSVGDETVDPMIQLHKSITYYAKPHNFSYATLIYIIMASLTELVNPRNID